VSGILVCLFKVICEQSVSELFALFPTASFLHCGFYKVCNYLHGFPILFFFGFLWKCVVVYMWKKLLEFIVLCVNADLRCYPLGVTKISTY